MRKWKIEVVRELFRLSIKYNFELRAVHNRGIDNFRSDIFTRVYQSNYLVKPYGILHGLPEITLHAISSSSFSSHWFFVLVWFPLQVWAHQIRKAN